MTRVRLALAVALLGASVLLARTTAVDAASLDTAAWWSAANAGPAAVPAPADVGPGDLLIQGAAPGTGIEGESALRQAVAGLRFTLAPGEEPAVLVLDLGSALPAEVGTVRACKLAAPFAAVENGAWADVPAHDCGTSVLGNVSGTALVFPGIAALASGNEVAVLLVPERVTRTVVRKPTAAALGVLAPSASDEPGSVDLPSVSVAGDVPAPLVDVGSLPTTTPAATPAPTPAADAPAFGSVQPVSRFRDPATAASGLVALAIFLVLSPLAVRRRGVIS